MHMLICSMVSHRSQALFIFLHYIFYLRLNNLMWLIFKFVDSFYSNLLLISLLNFFISFIFFIQNFYLVPFIIPISLSLFSIGWYIILILSFSSLDMLFFSLLDIFRIVDLKYLSRNSCLSFSGRFY